MNFAICMTIFLLANLFLGYISHRRGFANSDDYYMAGKSVNLTLQGLTTFATISSSFTMMGAIGYTAEHDISLYITKTRALLNAWGSPAVHRQRILETL